MWQTQTVVAPERGQGGSKQLRHICRRLLLTLNEEHISNMLADALFFFAGIMSIIFVGELGCIQYKPKQVKVDFTNK